MHEGIQFMDPDETIRPIVESRKCLIFVVERYFHPKVICAEPGGSCQRLENTILLLSRNLAREEQIMEETGYPGLDAHKKEHETILRNLETLRRTLICGCYDNELVFEFVMEWAENHAREYDRSFDEYLNGQGPDAVHNKGH